MRLLKKDDVTGTDIWRPHEPTRSEQAMADALRKAGLKFKKEVPIKGFTVDFLVDEWLVIEVDGESHLTSGRQKKDLARQKALEESGFTVLRVPATDLFSRGNVNRLIKQVRDMAASPPHLSQGGFLNTAYREQLDGIRKALLQGEKERKKRESMAFGPSPGQTAGATEGFSEQSREGIAGERMSDYFGKDAEDFGALLEDYDWQKGEVASRELPRKAGSGATWPRKVPPRRR